MIRLILIFLFFNVFSSSVFSQSDRYQKLKIFINDTSVSFLRKQHVNLAHAQIKPGEYIVGVFSLAEKEIIRNSEMNYKVLVSNMTKYYEESLSKKSLQDTSPYYLVDRFTDTVTVPTDFKLGSMAGYYRYEQILEHLDFMYEKYPHLITKKKAIDTFKTYEGREIYSVKISDNPNIDEKQEEEQVLYTALHHAREPMSVSQMIFFMYYILENYDKNTAIKNLLDNRELVFVPCVNPDGYMYNQTTARNGGGMWRKNRRLNADGSYGVDLNRNYGKEWGTTGASPLGRSETYRGIHPFSEPETQAIRYLCEKNDFKLALNYHAFGELLLFPYGYGYLNTKDDRLYSSITSVMTKHNHYHNMQSSYLYPASGDSDDWMYSQKHILAMTPEIGDDFWMPTNTIISTAKASVWQNISMAMMAGNCLEIQNAGKWKKIGENHGRIKVKFRVMGILPEDHVYLNVKLGGGVQLLPYRNHYANIEPFEWKELELYFSYDTMPDQLDVKTWVKNHYSAAVESTHLELLTEKKSEKVLPYQKGK